jgi:hypothetical protein
MTNEKPLSEKMRRILEDKNLLEMKNNKEEIKTNRFGKSYGSGYRGTRIRKEKLILLEEQLEIYLHVKEAVEKLKEHIILRKRERVMDMGVQLTYAEIQVQIDKIFGEFK